MSPLCIQIATLIVLTLTFLAAVWYAWEARKQAEALLKPCVTLETIARDAVDAILGSGGIRGEAVLAFHNGHVSMMNIGNGPAIHISYAVIPVDPPPDSNRGRHEGYVHAIQPRDSALLPISRGFLDAYEFQFEISYESLSGQRYRTKIKVHDLVLKDFRFTEKH